MPHEHSRHVFLLSVALLHALKKKSAIELCCCKSELYAGQRQNFGIPYSGLTLNSLIQIFNGSYLTIYLCACVFLCVYVYRLLGKLVVGLQHIITSGRLLLREPLTDSNHLLTDVSIRL